MNNKKHWLLLLGIFFTLNPFLNTYAQSDSTKGEKGYNFTVIKDLGATSVKDQSRSGTCWSFAGNAFLESELLRLGKGEYDLSEMWIVRNTYIDKAEKYVRMHGELTFACGGAFHDVFNVIRKYGIVPEEAYPGLGYGTEKHNHAELDAVLEAYVKAVVENKAKSLSTAWMAGYIGILDAYLGQAPENFKYKGKTYNPHSFASSLGLDMDNYVSLTSFTHHPFYTQFILEIPDNWAWESSYNLPIDEFMSVFDSSLEKGYTLCWGADVSEKGFDYKKGLAVVPDADIESMDGTEQARWQNLTDKEREDELHKLDKPGKEKVITQNLRQQGFDNYTTTDDHGMIITGIATDQNGAKYYRVKNSWGTVNHIYEGYFYASESFVAYKTMNIVVHKDAIPDPIKTKLGIF